MDEKKCSCCEDHEYNVSVLRQIFDLLEDLERNEYRNDKQIPEDVKDNLIIVHEDLKKYASDDKYIKKKICNNCGMYLNINEIDEGLGICWDCQNTDMQLQAIGDTH